MVDEVNLESKSQMLDLLMSKVGMKKKGKRYETTEDTEKFSEFSKRISLKGWNKEVNTLRGH